MIILLINLHSFFNIGDAVLAKESIKLLKNYFPESKIILAMNDPSSNYGIEETVNSFTKFYKLTSKNTTQKWRINTIIGLFLSSLNTALFYRYFNKKFFLGMTPSQKVLISSYLDADIVVSVAGNALYSSGNFGLQFMITTFSMAYAILLDKPLYFLPQSIGPITRKWEGMFLRWIVNQSRIVMIRESISLSQLEKFKINKQKVFQVPDLAFAYQGSEPDQAEKWLAEQGVDIHNDGALIGITVINWREYNQGFLEQKLYEDAVVIAINEFIKITQGKAIIFTQVGGSSLVANDYIVSKRIHKGIISTGQQSILTDFVNSPKLIKSAYGFMDIFLGTRMHSNIFAISQGVPTLAIAYLYKTTGIMQDLGLNEWTIDIKGIEAESLTYMLIRLWNSRYNVKQTIEENLPLLIKKTAKAGLLIHKDFLSVYS